MKRIILMLALMACGTERTSNEPTIPHEQPDKSKKTTCWQEVKCTKVFLRGRLTIVCQHFDVCEEIESSTDNIKYNLTSD